MQLNQISDTNLNTLIMFNGSMSI